MRPVDMVNQALDASILPRLLYMTYRLDQELHMGVGEVTDKPVATCLVLMQGSRDHLDHHRLTISRLLDPLVIVRNLAQATHLLYPSILSECAILDRMLNPRVLRPPRRQQPTLCQKESTHLVCADSRRLRPSLEQLNHRSKPGMGDRLRVNLLS
jgi:hypothetical protein